MQGKIYLLPSTLGDDGLAMVLPQGVINTILGIRFFIVEDLRTARRFLKQLDRSFPVDDSSFIDYNEHTRMFDFSTVESWLLSGNNVGLMSEAGMPCIADPGSSIVLWAHLKNISVVPLTGPSSVFLALAASGLGGQEFAFNGYIPVKQPARCRMISHFELVAQKHNQTQIFIETPYRNNALIADVLNTCMPDTCFCVAAGISATAQFIRTMPVGQWRKTQIPDLSKIPAVFLIGSV